MISSAVYENTTDRCIRFSLQPLVFRARSDRAVSTVFFLQGECIIYSRFECNSETASQRTLIIIYALKTGLKRKRTRHENVVYGDCPQFSKKKKIKNSELFIYVLDVPATD